MFYLFLDWLALTLGVWAPLWLIKALKNLMGFLEPFLDSGLCQARWHGSSRLAVKGGFSWN